MPTLLVLGLLGLLVLALLALGVWQLERRAWKLALIDRVEQRLHAPTVDAPGPAEWPLLDAHLDEYRHVRLIGRYLADADTRVQAVTELGPGFWLLTPLRLESSGGIVLVNRGFVADGAARPAAAGRLVTVTGLLRPSEPGGAFLRRNDPAAGHWFSRDPAAIAAARGLAPVAPYFVDADVATTTPVDEREPVGGLTVVRFHNNHLVYALTWFVLAAMAAVATWRIATEERRRRAPGADPSS